MSDSSQDLSQIAIALAKAQSEMSSPEKNKVAENKSFKYRYADLPAVIEACMPALNANGIAVTQTIQNGEAGGTYLLTRLLHTSGQSISGETPLIFNHTDMKALGGAMSYARRYALMALTGLAPHEDYEDLESKYGGPDGEARLDVSNKEMLDALKQEAESHSDIDSIKGWWTSGKTAGLYRDLAHKWPEGAAELKDHVTNRVEAIKQQESEAELDAERKHREMDNAARAAAA